MIIMRDTPFRSTTVALSRRQGMNMKDCMMSMRDRREPVDNMGSGR